MTPASLPWLPMALALPYGLAVGVAYFLALRLNSRLYLDKGPVWQPIAQEVERGYPMETCGLIVRQLDGALRTIVCPNLQDRYHALDPLEFPRTSRTAYKLNERVIAKSADAGETLVAIWHSHCDAGAYFSAEDVRCAAPAGQALYPGVAYLVVSALGGKVRGAALYHFDAASGAFVAEPAAD